MTVLTQAQITEMHERGEYPTLAQLGRMKYQTALNIAVEMGIKSNFHKAYPHRCDILITQFDEWVEQTLNG